MATHYRLDGFSGLVGVVEWDGGYVVVQDVISLKEKGLDLLSIESALECFKCADSVLIRSDTSSLKIRLSTHKQSYSED